MLARRPRDPLQSLLRRGRELRQQVPLAVPPGGWRGGRAPAGREPGVRVLGALTLNLPRSTAPIPASLSHLVLPLVPPTTPRGPRLRKRDGGLSALNPPHLPVLPFNRNRGHLTCPGTAPLPAPRPPPARGAAAAVHVTSG